MNLLKSLPISVGVAFSGGIDSVVLVHRLKSLGKSVTLYYYDHGPEAVPDELEFVKQFADDNNFELKIETQNGFTPEGRSKEDYWSELRNTWFKKQSTVVCTGHHLDDAAEWYMMTALQGTGGYIMDYQNENIHRPLLTIRKWQIEQYATTHNLEYFSDKTNFDCSNLRSQVRTRLMPEIEVISPGIFKAVKNRIIAKTFNDD